MNQRVDSENVNVVNDVTCHTTREPRGQCQPPENKGENLYFHRRVNYGPVLTHSVVSVNSVALREMLLVGPVPQISNSRLPPFKRCKEERLFLIKLDGHNKSDAQF